MHYSSSAHRSTEAASEYMWIDTVLHLIKKVFRFKQADETQKGRHVLKDINIVFESGRIYGILGPNGSGKTTLMKIIADLFIPSSGSVQIIDDSGRLLDKSEKFICFIGAEDWLYFEPHLTCEENLIYIGKLNGLSEKEIKKTLEEAADLLDAKMLLKMHPHQISAGERQKISLLRGLLLESSVYLLDEPCDNLDILSREKFLNFLKSALKNRDVIVIYASHSFEELEEICDEFLFLFDGKVVFKGKKELFIQKIAKNKEKMRLFSKIPLSDDEIEHLSYEFSIEIKMRKITGGFYYDLKGNQLMRILEDVKHYFISKNKGLMEFELEEVNLHDIADEILARRMWQNNESDGI